MKKPFLITIDTESDNQWDKTHKQTTDNAKFIPRFQELCENYSLKPTYLIDYSMVQNDFLVEYLNDCLKRNTCEVGMHLHAWDTPPKHDLDYNAQRRPLLVEYPEHIMREKIHSLNGILEEKFAMKITSHRAGRWIVNKTYMRILRDEGYLVDCSVTPGIAWKNETRNLINDIDYSAQKKIKPYYIDDTKIMEVPVTIHKLYGTKVDLNNGYKRTLKSIAQSLLGKNIWLRPALCSYENMLNMMDVSMSSDEYIEFMMHSSELMPGGSPYYKTENDIDNMFDELTKLFSLARTGGYFGQTLNEYYNHIFLGDIS